ncbi:hypothetical protein F4859DRAFT_193969 [Xylaria cf. heliscus]|nr:hypothetical protein F4859DRAFT_193969 [Xylaria cf. heliscus]
MSFRITSHPALTATRRLSAITSHISHSRPLLNLRPVVIRSVGINRHFSHTMAPIPTTQKVVLINKTGGTDVLEYTDVPVPTPGSGHILVKNDFIGVNFIDTYFRSGLYPPAKFPYTLGREAEGTVVAVGEGNTYDVKVGDRVVYLWEDSYAQFTSVPADKAIKVPASFKPGTAAAALLQGLTALTLVREAHAVQKGDWVLVHAAAGGTGLLLLQLLKIIGANTIGTVSTPEKAALATQNGASHIINYSHEDVVTKVKELTGGKGVIAVFDGVGKATFDASLESLARKGTLVSFGNASGAVPPFSIPRLAAKNARVLRPTLGNYVFEREEFTHYTEELFGHIQKDGFNVRVHEIYPLSEVARAHEDLAGRKTTGKLLIDPSK